MHLLAVVEPVVVCIGVGGIGGEIGPDHLATVGPPVIVRVGIGRIGADVEVLTTVVEAVVVTVLVVGVRAEIRLLSVGEAVVVGVG